MTIAPILQQYLTRKHVVYDVIDHRETTSSIPTAEVCNIPPDRLAKGVVLHTRNGYLLAVLSASDRIQRVDLKQQLGGDFWLATEGELGTLFKDCAPGAVPAVGECYGLDVLVDDHMFEQPDIYFEGGDHSTIVHVSQAEFARFTNYMSHARFGAHD